MKIFDYIWLLPFTFCICLVNYYNLFELNLYTICIIYKFSEHYTSVICYLILLSLSIIILILYIFIPELITDLFDLLYNYFKYLYPNEEL